MVLGREAIVEMQRVTLAYYDEHWREVGWANGKRGEEADYNKWRAMTEEEIEGRWGPVSYMVAIVMRRQAGSKRMPEWEEAAAVACAVQARQPAARARRPAPSLPLGPPSAPPADLSPPRAQNMHLRRATKHIACYWSSWHEAARLRRDAELLGMGTEDRCLGFFVVAACVPTSRTGRAVPSLSVEWRA